MYVRDGKKRSRGFVRAEGGGARVNLSRRFFRSCFLRGCRFGDSCRHTVLHRWNVGERPTRGANIFPFYLTVLDTPRVYVPFLVFSSLFAPRGSSFRLLRKRERERYHVSMKAWSLRDKEIKRNISWVKVIIINYRFCKAEDRRKLRYFFLFLEYF